MADSRIETVEVGKFKNQATGSIHVVTKKRTITTSRSLSGEVSITRGLWDYKTSDGIELNAPTKDESTFATLHNPPQILVRV